MELRRDETISSVAIEPRRDDGEEGERLSSTTEPRLTGAAWAAPKRAAAVKAVWMMRGVCILLTLLGLRWCA